MYTRVCHEQPVQNAPVAGERELFDMPQKRRRLAEPAEPQPPPPEQKPWQRDPLKLLDAVSFSLKLRQVAEWSDAFDDIHRYIWEGEEDAPERDRRDDPSRGVVDRAKVKVDVAAMLIERRIFAKEMAEDSILAINCFSDSSPVVGSELQGMLVDFYHKDDTVRRATLPGQTLHYGHFDSINKIAAFLWAVWLICGPLTSAMRYFCDKCMSWTTDFGT